MHTFLISDVPEKFLPLQLVRWIAKRNHPVLNWLMHNLNPFTDNDTFDKYQAFLTTAKYSTQNEVYQNCKKNYPDGTQFMVLAMDLKYMGAGKVPRNYVDQLEELAALEKLVLKFIHIDPRRGDALQLLSYYHRTKGFSGVKLYPTIGYYPYDEVLMPIYKYCSENQLPVISHGSPMGPVYFKGSRDELLYLTRLHADDPAVKGKNNQEICKVFNTPDNYAYPLMKFPDMNLCIAHFGSDDWEGYVKGEKTDNWVQMIIDLITRYDNCWTDVSFTMHNEDFWPMFKILITDNTKVRERVMFGTDYYVNQTVTTEREFCIRFRAFLGEDLFRQIAEVNPRNFLKNKLC